MLHELKPKEATVWAVVVDNRVIDIYVGHPDLYTTWLSDEIEISLIEWEHQTRGCAKIGDIWDGHKFINQTEIRRF